MSTNFASTNVKFARMNPPPVNSRSRPQPELPLNPISKWAWANRPNAVGRRRPRTILGSSLRPLGRPGRARKRSAGTLINFAPMQQLQPPFRLRNQSMPMAPTPSKKQLHRVNARITRVWVIAGRSCLPPLHYVPKLTRALQGLEEHQTPGPRRGPRQHLAGGVCPCSKRGDSSKSRGLSQNQKRLQNCEVAVDSRKHLPFRYRDNR